MNQRWMFCLKDDTKEQSSFKDLEIETIDVVCNWACDVLSVCMVTIHNAHVLAEVKKKALPVTLTAV